MTIEQLLKRLINDYFNAYLRYPNIILLDILSYGKLIKELNIDNIQSLTSLKEYLNCKVLITYSENTITVAHSLWI